VRPYLGILADDGAGALRLIRRYDGAIGGWTMSRSDRIQLADFIGDGRQDVLITNGGDGGTTSVGMLRSSPPNLQLVRRYDGVLAGWHQRPGDQLYPADIDGSGRKGLYVFNGTNWSVRYLAMFRSTGSAYQMVRRYDDVAAGWNMRQKDRFVVGDFDADGREDLYVFNGENWSMAYLAMLRSTGSALTMVPPLRRVRTRLADAQARPALRCRPQRRRADRPVRLEPRRLEQGVPRHHGVERQRAELQLA
jgi:hypothetical protein